MLTYGLCSSTTDLTTLYATATFWTYGFSLLLLKTRLSHLTLTAILVAFLGVAVITYSGAHENDASPDDGTRTKEPPHRMLGDLIMLIGAICLGFYEVVYKMSLPEGHGGVASPSTAEEQDISINGYEAVQTEEDGLDLPPRPATRPALSNNDARNSSSLPLVKQDTEPQASSSLPLALHANFLTSLIGVATLLLFWIPIPLLHWTGLEEFELPYGHFGLLAVICTMGATYVSCQLASNGC